MLSRNYVFFVFFMAVLILIILSGCEDDCPTLPCPSGTIVITSSPDSLDAAWSLIGPNDYSSEGTGSKTFTNFPVGDYSITWADIDGFETPVSRTVKLETDATVSFTGVYVAEIRLGNVEINTIPDTLNAGWSLAGPDGYTNTGTGTQTMADLSIGDYTVTWSPAEGFVKPAPETATLAAGLTLLFTGNYVAEASTGTVEINPIPVSLNAGWTLSGPDGYTTTGTGTQALAGLAFGDYTVTWSPAEGFVPPSPETGALALDEILTFTGTYVTGFGNISINPEPDSINASWTVTGPNGFSEVGSEDHTFYHQLTGEYTISWGAVEHYITPAAETILLDIDSLITFTGAYVAEIPGQITINPEPDGIAPTWNLTGPAGYYYAGSGEMTVSGLWPGEYSLVWGDVVNWISPDDAFIELESNGNIVQTGTYLPLVAFGTIEIDVSPDDIDAPWDLSGPNGFLLHGMGDATIGNMLVGEYSLVFGDVSGYPTPPSSTRTLVAYATCTFTGAYYDFLFPETVLIPALSVSMPAIFTMGSTVQSSETPHQVTLTGRFTMAVTEVTNEQYVEALQWAYGQGYVTASSASVRDALDGSTRELFDLTDSGCQISFSGGVFSTSWPDRPVAAVSWYGSVAYCDWLSLLAGLPRAYDHYTWRCGGGNPYAAVGYRLPTEAEWEFACRAGTTTHFNTGDCLDAGTEANSNGNFPYPDCPSGPYLEHASDAGSYPANQWGLLDIHGNVGEWCNDRYGQYSGDVTDPTGSESGNNGVFRGGSWYVSAFGCRSAHRYSSNRSYTAADVGFRLVRSY